MALTDEQQPQFPSYPNTGIPVANPKQGGPLFKLRNFMIKPKVKLRLPKRSLSVKKKHQVKFL